MNSGAIRPETISFDHLDIDKKDFDVGAGQQIAVAKGETHGFVNIAKTPAPHLIITSPARHDELLTALSRLADPHAPGATDEICRVYNQKIIGEPRRGPHA